MREFHRACIISKREEDQMNWAVSHSSCFFLISSLFSFATHVYFEFLFLQSGVLTSVNLHLFVSEWERRRFTSHFTRGLTALARMNRSAAGDLARNRFSNGTFASVSSSVVLLVLLLPLSRSVSCLPHSIHTRYRRFLGNPKLGFTDSRLPKTN